RRACTGCRRRHPPGPWTSGPTTPCAHPRSRDPADRVGWPHAVDGGDRARRFGGRTRACAGPGCTAATGRGTHPAATTGAAGAAGARAAPRQAQPGPGGVPSGVPYAAPYGSPYGYAPAEAMFRSGRRQRTVGVVLTSVGIGLAVVAGLLWFDADTRHGGDSID